MATCTSPLSCSFRSSNNAHDNCRPRNGKNIGPFDLVYALQSAYNLDSPIAHLLAIGGFFLVHHDSMTSLPSPPPSLAKNPRGFVRSVLTSFDHLFEPHMIPEIVRDVTDWAKNWLQYRTMDLQHIGLHGHIEHDASITHDDALLPTSPYAPSFSNHSLFEAFMDDSVAGPDGAHVDLVDLGTARVRREEESLSWSGRALDALHAEIARGEAALVIGIFGETLSTAPANVSHVGEHWDWEGLAVPKSVMRTFWLEERFPHGWKPSRVTSLKSTKAGNQRVGNRMQELRALAAAGQGEVKAEGKDASVPAVDEAQFVLSH
jgi:hypothetical protein